MSKMFLSKRRDLKYFNITQLCVIIIFLSRINSFCSWLWLIAVYVFSLKCEKKKKKKRKKEKKTYSIREVTKHVTLWRTLWSLYTSYFQSEHNLFDAEKKCIITKRIQRDTWYYVTVKPIFNGWSKREHYFKNLHII